MANGTIAFDTLSTSGQISGTAKSIDTDFLLNGSAKAWCKWSLSDQSSAIGSFNVTSITDNAAGVGTCNLTNAFSAATFATFHSSSQFHAWDDTGGSASTINLAAANASHAKTDTSRAHVGGFGDLA